MWGLQKTWIKIPGSGRSFGEGHGYPLQYSCLEYPMDSVAWRATDHKVTKSQTRLKRLSMARNMVMHPSPPSNFGTFLSPSNETSYLYTHSPPPPPPPPVRLLGPRCYLVCKSCLTCLWPQGYSLPGFSVYEISQTRILRGCRFLLQGIFLTQGLNPHLLHCRWILFHWATKEAPASALVNY